MEKNQHVQVPTMNLVKEGLTYSDPFVYACIKKYMNSHTQQAWPSNATLAKLSGLSAKTIIEAVRRLEAAGYITVKREFGKPNVYTFNDYKKFEIFSYEFLDRKDLTSREKSYLIVAQPKMFKSDTGGVITMNSTDFAESIALTPRTLRKYEKDLKDKGLLEMQPYKLDNSTGCPVYLRSYNFDQWSNLVALKFMEQDERLDSHEEELKRLKQQVEFLTKELQKQKMEDAEIIL